ncbi:DUF6048 family protein [Flavobacteriaceae bacterium]|jgi:hypothetical protein|nr:DUF6048 family protein [Flavobacteriaceae bacterium]|tara:strand:+ start:703 stop:1401 length:699 start_codon:yes stop_codon:yes gene_type:complete
MLISFTRILLVFLIPVTIFSQENIVSTDSVTQKQKYGLRLGLDINKLVNSSINNNYDGFELNADYRIGNKLYIASEIGLIENTEDEEYINFTTKGTYIKSGIDYNMYTNWIDMQNMIFAGFRIGYSNFEQTINNYTIYDTNNQIWGQSFINTPINNEDLSSLWVELIIGLKAEIFNNLFLGFNLEVKKMVNSEIKNNIQNMYVPGFNKTFEGSSFGVGFGYKLSYLIPIVKK